MKGVTRHERWTSLAALGCRATWRLWCSVLITCVWAIVFVATANGAVVIPKEGDPAYGYLQRNDADRVVIREVLPTGETRDREFARAEIDELIVTVDPERLRELRPTAPQDYLEYAEDLAEKRRDPEARDAALRLYLIAAWLAPEKYGRGALLGMTALARSDEERRAFRALAFTLDAGRDPTLLREENLAGTRAKPTAPETPTSDALLECVRQLRRGQRTVAKRHAERPEVKAEFARLTGLLSYDEFLGACLDPVPSEPVMRALLKAELALMPVAQREVATPAETPRATPNTWTAALVSNARPLPTLTLERVTEFDPRQCVYTSGKWIVPKDPAPAKDAAPTR